MPHQLPPEGDWRSWVILGGRGAGKTRAGAEWVRAQVEGALPLDEGRARRVALVGETFDQVRDVMIFGDSGILACSPPDRRPKWKATERKLIWPNGAEAQVFSAHDPEGLRGPQFDGAWVDELAKWKKAGDTWDMLQFALRLAERWLTEARVSRDSVRFALPPSMMHLGAGDVVSLTGEAGEVLYRIDRVEQSELQLVEAVRIEPEVYLPSEFPDDAPAASDFVPAAPVLPLFLDLPLMSGDEVEHAPHLAVTSKPWSGSVAVYASGSDDNYSLNNVVAARSIVGVTETALQAAPSGRWDNGVALQVKLISGALESRTAEAVLDGANLAAIGDGSSGVWELFQFQTAELIAPDTYLLSGRLRGQAGSDALMPEAWAEGSWVVLMDGTPDQIELSSAHRRISWHYRIGPAAKGYSDPSYVHLIEAFNGNGLRPYSPCHLSTETAAKGDITFSWLRRTRIDGDSWDLTEVPLGEDSEQYTVRLRQGATIVREETVSTPVWTYTTQLRAADGLSGLAVIEVAQVSARYGPGVICRDGSGGLGRMRPVLHGDVSCAARALLKVSKAGRAAMCERMIQEADAADRHFHQTGRSHVVWGNGSLMGAVRKRVLAEEPTFSCPDYCACFEMVLHALIAHHLIKRRK